MDEGTKEYRNNELGRVEPSALLGNYSLKVRGSDDTATKWLTIDEAELTAIQRLLIGDGVALALDILKANGYAVKACGPEDVHKVLDAYMNDNTSGVVDTLQHRDEITKHVMEGDDWESVIDTDDSFAYIWDVVEGTQHDHPEWFPMQEQEDPFAGTTTLALVDRYATLRAVCSVTSTGPAEFVVNELENLRRELVKRLGS